MSYPSLLGRGCSSGYGVDRGGPLDYGDDSADQSEIVYCSDSIEELCRPASIRFGVSGRRHGVTEFLTLER